MSDRISVSPEVLRRLAETCTVIACQLDQLGRTVFDAGPEVTGTNRLSNALEQYHSSWSRRREALLDDLEGASAALETIATSFEQQDSALGAA